MNIIWSPELIATSASIAIGLVGIAVRLAQPREKDGERPRNAEVRTEPLRRVAVAPDKPKPKPTVAGVIDRAGCALALEDAKKGALVKVRFQGLCTVPGVTERLRSRSEVEFSGYEYKPLREVTLTESPSPLPHSEEGYRNALAAWNALQTQGRREPAPLFESEVSRPGDQRMAAAKSGNLVEVPNVGRVRLLRFNRQNGRWDVRIEEPDRAPFCMTLSDQELGL